MKTGILLVNLGTPDSPSVPDVRKYLREFLSDPRVIDINPVSRFMLVNFIIAPIRAPKSAKLYREVWTKNGSPLLWYTSLQAKLLQEKLGNKYEVKFAMRYQSPSIESVLNSFDFKSVNKIKVIPLFPQYASASTGSVYEEIMRITSTWQITPSIEFVRSFAEDEGFIHAFAEIGKKHQPENYDHVLFSYHGLPERQIKKADAYNYCLTNQCCENAGEAQRSCYRAQCFKTTKLLAAKLNIPDSKYTICFQSRLGRSAWIQPFTDEVLRDLGSKKIKRLLVFSPAFTSDCLETIQEIGVEYKKIFRDSGGEELTLVESLNDSPAWIDALAGLATA